MTCFTTGTVVTTLKGEVAIEDLEVGDRVVTRDNGLQTVRRISWRTYDFGQLSQVPHLHPILVSAGALGKGLPESDMLVSPNLRILETGAAAQAFGAGKDSLKAAKNMVDSRTIRACSVLGVTYVHVEFHRHETILANGAWVEAFHSADPALGPVGNAQRLEMFEVFPELREPAASAMPAPATAYQAAERHAGH